MAYESSENRRSAEEDFRRARRQAALQDIVARLSGKSVELFAYEDVRQKLRGLESSGRKLEDIPLEAVVGSVARYKDFTRSFLPRRSIHKDRWIRVKMAMEGLSGVPPIEVYRIGDAYFVADGNHRVSVARQMGLSHLQGYITEVKTRVPLSPDIQPDGLILKAEYADFLARTRLTELRPDADLTVTVPGKYPVLLEHIDVHRHFMGIEQQREIPYEEAATHWYDTVYLPVVHIIRERGILREFPKRTETDLYLYLSQHRAELEEALGWEISFDAAIDNLMTRFQPRARHAAIRAYGMQQHTLTADATDRGPPAPRRQRQTGRHEDRLFGEILVAINGEQSGWNTLEQAFEVARQEGARLHGLHVVATEAERNNGLIQTIQAEFDRRCEIAGIRGRLAIEVGGCANKICERALWADLIVTGFTHPLSCEPSARLSPEFRNLLHQSPRPVLVVTAAALPLNRVLLAYDGSPKAEEALYIATYLVENWKVALVVVTVSEAGYTSSKIQSRAKEYLENHEVHAAYAQDSGDVAETILSTADAHGSELILMGGYGHSRPLESVLGSAVNQALCNSRYPVLICR